MMLRLTRIYSVSTYAYVNGDGFTTYVSDASLNFRGTWTPEGTYFPPADVVDYTTGHYIVLASNINVVPITEGVWSPLVLFQGTDAFPPDTATQALLLAESAYNLAAVGTNVGTNAYDLAQTGSNIAYSGSIIAANGHQVITSLLPDPNVAGIFPYNRTLGNIFYQDPILAPKNEWKWSTSSGTWIHTP